MDFNEFEKEIVAKIDAGEKLSEQELRELVWEYETDQVKHDSGRWTQTIETIVELCGRTFRIMWGRGLTECQDNEFNCQPVEVKKHTYEKTITVTEWIPIEKDSTMR